MQVKSRVQGRSRYTWHSQHARSRFQYDPLLPGSGAHWAILHPGSILAIRAVVAEIQTSPDLGEVSSLQPGTENWQACGPIFVLIWRKWQRRNEGTGGLTGQQR